MAALRELCEGARAAALPLLLDAEQTHRQPAIGMLTRTLSREYSPPAPRLCCTTPTRHTARGRGVRLRAEMAHAATHAAARAATHAATHAAAPAACRLQPRLPTVAASATYGCRRGCARSCPCTHARLHARRQAGAPLGLPQP